MAEQGGVADDARIYPCDRCGAMRTRAEGGTVFSVCDTCWDLLHPMEPEPVRMTLRDWFAGKALTVFSLNDGEVAAILGGAVPRHDIAARFCYDLADAMIRARALTPESVVPSSSEGTHTP